MAYDHTIGALNAAIKAIEENDIEKRWKNNNKACEILGHLWSTLDIENGGPIAENLNQLYAFMLTKLPEVDFRNNPQPARDVIKLLIPLRDAWKELSEKMTPAELEQAEREARAKLEAGQDPSTVKTAVPSAPAAAAPAPAKPAQPAPTPAAAAKPAFAQPMPQAPSTSTPSSGVSVSC